MILLEFWRHFCCLSVLLQDKVPDSAVVGRRLLYEAWLCLDRTFMGLLGTCLPVELNKQGTQLYCGAAVVGSILPALPTKQVPLGLIARKGCSTQQKIPQPETLWSMESGCGGPGLGCATSCTTMARRMVIFISLLINSRFPGSMIIWKTWPAEGQTPEGRNMNLLFISFMTLRVSPWLGSRSRLFGQLGLGAGHRAACTTPGPLHTAAPHQQALFLSRMNVQEQLTKIRD